MLFGISQSDSEPTRSGLSRRHFIGAVAGATAAFALPSRSHANLTTLPAPLPLSSAMRTGNFHKAPAGWFKLIKRHPKLNPAAHKLTPIALTGEREMQLLRVHQRVNRLIRFRPERKDRWQLGVTVGDCEDYAIRKLDMLCSEYGWPRSALTLAACRVEDGQGHAVLLVHSDKGVYALDNRRGGVEPWRKLPYRWIAREEPGAPFGLWRKLLA